MTDLDEIIDDQCDYEALTAGELRVKILSWHQSKLREERKSLVKQAVHYTEDELVDGLDPWAVPVGVISALQAQPKEAEE